MTSSATSPKSRVTRALSTRPVAVRRPQPIMSKAIPARARANLTRPLAGGQRPRRGPPPMLSTASGKQSESEHDGTGHESWPTESRRYNPSLFLEPKIRKHGRIENGSVPLKTLPTHHVAERAVMSGESQQQAGGVRCERATSPSPAPKGAEEVEARSRAPDERPETLPPLSLDRGRAGGEESSWDAA